METRKLWLIISSGVNPNLVFNKLLALDAQVVVTVLNNTLLDRLQRDNTAYKMFHVEHGKVTAIE
mgnify:CR=1 FL=1